MQPPNESPLPLDEEAARLLERYPLVMLVTALVVVLNRRALAANPREPGDADATRLAQLIGELSPQASRPLHAQRRDPRSGAPVGGEALAARVAAAGTADAAVAYEIQGQLIEAFERTGAAPPSVETILRWAEADPGAVRAWIASRPEGDDPDLFKTWWTGRRVLRAHLAWWEQVEQTAGQPTRSTGPARAEGRIVIEPEDRTPTAEDAEPFAKRLIRDVLLEAFEGVSSLPDMEDVVDWTAEDSARVRRWAARRPVRPEEEARRAWWSTRPDVLMAYAPWFILATPAVLSGVVAPAQDRVWGHEVTLVRRVAPESGWRVKITVPAERARHWDAVRAMLDEVPGACQDAFQVDLPASTPPGLLGDLVAALAGGDLAAVLFAAGALKRGALHTIAGGQVTINAEQARVIRAGHGLRSLTLDEPKPVSKGDGYQEGLRARDASLSARNPVSGPVRDERVLGADRGPGICQAGDGHERAEQTYTTYARVPAFLRSTQRQFYDLLVEHVGFKHREEIEATFGRPVLQVGLPEIALWYALREPGRAFEALLPVTTCPAQALDALCPNPAPLAWGWLAVEHPSAVLTMLQRFVVEAVIQVTRVERHPVATEATIREHLPKAWRAHGIKQALHALVSRQILREHNGIPDMGFSLRSNEAEDASPADPRRPVMGFARERAAHAAELRSFFGKPADELSASQVALWFAIRHPGAASNVLRELASTGANGPVHLETLFPFTYRHAWGWAHVEAPDSWEKMTVLEWAVLDVLVRDGGPDALTLEGIAERLDHPPVVLDEVIRALHGLRALNVAHEVAEGWRVGVQPSRETLTRNLEERAQEGDLLAKKIVDAARAAGLLFEGDVSFTAGHLLYLVELLGEVGRNEVLALQAFKAKTARLVEAEVYRAAQRDDAAWGPGHEVSLETALAYHRKATDTMHGLWALNDGAHHAVAHLEGPLQESGALAKRWGQRVLEMNLPPVRTAPPAREDAGDAAKDGSASD